LGCSYRFKEASDAAARSKELFFQMLKHASRHEEVNQLLRNMHQHFQQKISTEHPELSDAECLILSKGHLKRVARNYIHEVLNN
jgi:hypothetical protein